MRVLQVVTHMNRGGLETMLMNYYRHIDRNKVQFDFLTHRYTKADYDDEIAALGGKIYYLPRLIPWSPSYKKALNQFFTDHPEYQIIHVHQDCLSSVILKVAKQHNVLVRIAHSHSSSQDKNIKYLIKLWYKRSIPKYATHLFACGKKAGDWMFNGAPYSIFNNAISVSDYIPNAQVRMQMRSKLGFTDELVIGHVGRFSYPKNHPFLLEIFAALFRKKQNVALLLIGGGDRIERVRKQAQELGIIDRVHFLGVRDDVPDLMQAMDVFVFPSLYEGLPVTMVEAQAAGLPCIISDKVPSECIIADGLIDVLPLRETPDIWAYRILSRAQEKRTDHRAEIIAHGYDVANEAAKLQQFYLEAVR